MEARGEISVSTGKRWLTSPGVSWHVTAWAVVIVPWPHKVLSTVLVCPGM